MKIFFVAILLVSFLQSSEMQRIESIVEDITKLRADYESCQESLKSEKNEDEIIEYQRLLKDEREKSVILEAELNYSKDEILALKKKLSLKPIEVCSKSKESNVFPKLMPKEKVQTFKASSFRLKNSSSIYDAPDGNMIDAWEKKRSFTSNKKIGSWIKITGYFVDKQWRKAKVEMWVKELDVSKR